MKHKTFSFLLALLIGMVVSVVSAHDFGVDGIYYNITSSTNKTVAVTYQGSSSRAYTGSVTIPETVTYNGITYSITSIGGQAFEGCRGLTSIEIPNSVASIGSTAFYNCTGLEKATFASIKSLCKISFVDFYSNPLYYAKHLYIGDEEVTEVVIPDDVTTIGEYNQEIKGETNVEVIPVIA